MFSFPESPAFLSGRVVQDVDDGFDAEAVQKLALEMIDPQTRQQMVCFFFFQSARLGQFCGWPHPLVFILTLA